MRVLHIFNEIKFSGAEIMYANAAKLFNERGCKLFAFSTGSQPGEYVQNFEDVGISTFHRPIRFSIFSSQAIRYYKEVVSFIRINKVDVLHIHRSDIYFFAIMAWLCKIKCIKTQHNTFRNRWFTLPLAITQRFIMRKVFNVVYHTIGESVFTNELKYYKNPSVRVNNWYDSKRFYPATSNEEKVALRRRLNVELNAFVVLSAGGCSHIKNHHDIIRAMALVVKEMPNCIYLHLGHGVTEMEEIELCESLGVKNNVMFLGNQPNVRDYLVMADTFVMSSKFEGLSIASIEAMACEKPLILYNSPGLKDLIAEDDNGFLIEPNYKLLATRILYSISNPSKIKEQGLNAKRFSEAHFSIEKGVEKILKLYESR